MDDIRVLEVLNERIEKISAETFEALIDENWFGGLDNAEDLATVIDGDSITYRDAAYTEIRSAIAQTAASVFLGTSRDITQFTDSAGRNWLMTGGLSSGERPTERCDDLAMLDVIGISAQRINRASTTNDPAPAPPESDEAKILLEDIASQTSQATEHIDGVVLDQIAEGLRSPEWNSGYLEAIAALVEEVRPVHCAQNRFDRHGHERKRGELVDGSDWDCR